MNDPSQNLRTIRKLSEIGKTKSNNPSKHRKAFQNRLDYLESKQNKSTYDIAEMNAIRWVLKYLPHGQFPEYVI